MFAWVGVSSITWVANSLIKLGHKYEALDLLNKLKDDTYCVVREQVAKTLGNIDNNVNDLFDDITFF